MTRCAHEHCPHPVASPACPSEDHCSSLAARISHSCLPILAEYPPTFSPHYPGSALSQFSCFSPISPPSYLSYLFLFLFLLLFLVLCLLSALLLWLSPHGSSPVSLMLTSVPAAHAQQQHPSAAPAPQSNKYHDVRVGCGGGGCPIHDGHGLTGEEPPARVSKSRVQSIGHPSCAWREL